MILPGVCPGLPSPPCASVSHPSYDLDQRLRLGQPFPTPSLPTDPCATVRFTELFSLNQLTGLSICLLALPCKERGPSAEVTRCSSVYRDLYLLHAAPTRPAKSPVEFIIHETLCYIFYGETMYCGTIKACDTCLRHLTPGRCLWVSQQRERAEEGTSSQRVGPWLTAPVPGVHRAGPESWLCHLPGV